MTEWILILFVIVAGNTTILHKSEFTTAGLCLEAGGFAKNTTSAKLFDSPLVEYACVPANDPR